MAKRAIKVIEMNLPQKAVSMSVIFRSLKAISAAGLEDDFLLACAAGDHRMTIAQRDMNFIKHYVAKHANAHLLTEDPKKLFSTFKHVARSLPRCE